MKPTENKSCSGDSDRVRHNVSTQYTVYAVLYTQHSFFGHLFKPVTISNVWLTYYHLYLQSTLYWVIVFSVPNLFIIQVSIHPSMTIQESIHYPFIHPSNYSFPVSIQLSIHPSIFSHIHSSPVSIHLFSINSSIHPSKYPSIQVFIHTSIIQDSMHLPTNVAIHQIIPSIHSAKYSSIQESIQVSIHPSSILSDLFKYSSLHPVIHPTSIHLSKVSTHSSLH